MPMSDPLAFVGSHIDRFRSELDEFLRIPSVSAKSEHDQDTRRAAGWLSDRLQAAGLDSRIVETSWHPIVLAEWRGAPAAPTVLIYGHYDVQPPEPLDQWVSPPFRRSSPPCVTDASTDAARPMTKASSTCT
jgi:acetylornithine deacetylase/succinyl-diaminopimelate desuccinylase-like protein